VPAGNGESKSGGSSGVLLHGAVNKAVGELEATRKGQRRADDLSGGFAVHFGQNRSRSARGESIGPGVMEVRTSRYGEEKIRLA
jgi:hypothetical protein